MEKRSIMKKESSRFITIVLCMAMLGITLAACAPKPSVITNPAELKDLVCAEATGEFGSVKIEDAESLKWIEEHFSKATKLDGWPNCPYDMTIRLTCKNGAVLEVQPAMDSCDNMLVGGNDWYCYNCGNSKELFDRFGLDVMIGNVTIKGQ